MNRILMAALAMLTGMALTEAGAGAQSRTSESEADVARQRTKMGAEACRRMIERYGEHQVTCSTEDHPVVSGTPAQRAEAADTIALIAKPDWSIAKGLHATFLGGCSTGFEALAAGLGAASFGADAGEALAAGSVVAAAVGAAADRRGLFGASVRTTCQSVEYDSFKALHYNAHWFDSQQVREQCRGLFRRHNTKWSELAACAYVTWDLEQLINETAQ